MSSQQTNLRPRMFRSLVLAGLSVLLVTSCSKPKKPNNETPATSGTAESATPEIQDKSNAFDPQGSDSGKIDGLNTVHFGYDQASLTAETKKTLASNAEWIKGHTNVTVQIEGHTDARGSVEYNLSLGERRAKAVKSYLEGLGVESKRMTIISYGEEKPIAHGDSESAYAQNRRANFVPLQ
jgi:peptidoglycan-associated lipoprotein